MTREHTHATKSDFGGTSDLFVKYPRPMPLRQRIMGLAYRREFGGKKESEQKHKKLSKIKSV